MNCDRDQIYSISINYITNALPESIANASAPTITNAFYSIENEGENKVEFSQRRAFEGPAIKCSNAADEQIDNSGMLFNIALRQSPPGFFGLLSVIFTEQCRPSRKVEMR